MNECGACIMQNIHIIMPKMFKLLSDNEVERTVKVRCIASIGDIIQTSN